MSGKIEPAYKFDVIIVGGGHNGLVAAFYLARASLKVLILEARDQVGGLCSPIEFFPGYRGTITNTPAGLDSRVSKDMRLEELGLKYDRPDPTVVVPFEDGRVFRGWRDKSEARKEVARFSERDVEAYFGIIEFYNRLANVLQVSMYEPPPTFRELVNRLQTEDDEADFAEVMFGSIRDFLDARLESPHLKALLASLSMSAGNVAPSTPGSAIGLLRRPLSLATARAVEESDPRKHLVRGSTGLPRGGMGRIAELMEVAARGAGVTIKTGTRVNRVTVSPEGRAKGVVLDDGTEFTANYILSNLHPKTTLLGMVGRDHLPDDIATRLDRLAVRGAAFKLVLALDGLPRLVAAGSDNEALQYASCQYRYSPSVEYLEEAYADFAAGIPSRRPKLLGLTPSVMDPTLAPPGRHLMSVNVWYAPYHLSSGSWESGTKEKFVNTCIETISEFIPNIKDIIVDSRAYSPLDFEREFGLLEGHQLHGDMMPGGYLGFRPIPHLSRYRTPIAGLYLCGSGTWPGGTVTGLPGYNGAHAVLADIAGHGNGSSAYDIPPAG